MAKFLLSQKIRFGEHTLEVVGAKEGRVHVRCVDDCCSVDVRVAIAAMERELITIIDSYNYQHARSNMDKLVASIRSVTHGPSQMQEDMNIHLKAGRHRAV